MFHLLSRAPLAEDDGRAWSFKRVGSLYVRDQTSDLSVTLLEEPAPVIRVEGEILVAQDVATAIAAVHPRLARRVARVRGPQPLMEPRPVMWQLVGSHTLHVAEAFLIRDPHGAVKNVTVPYALVRDPKVPDPSVCKIAEDQMTVVSDAVMAVLLEHAPGLEFESIPWEGDPLPEKKAVAPPRIPTRDELLEQLKRRH